MTFCPEAPIERFCVIDTFGEVVGTDATVVGEGVDIAGLSIEVVTVGAITDVALHLFVAEFHVSFCGQLHTSVPLAVYDPAGLPSPLLYCV
jgi:hypothetical protein